MSSPRSASTHSLWTSWLGLGLGLALEAGLGLAREVGLGLALEVGPGLALEVGLLGLALGLG